MALTVALTTRTGAATTYHAVDLYAMQVPLGFIYDLELVELRAGGQAIAGTSRLTATSAYHALLWNHSNGVVVDLHPFVLGDVVQSEASSTVGTQHAGTGLNANNKLIGLLWNGGSETAVKLHPYLLKSITESECLTTDGVHQVGVGYTTSGVGHALLWNGTPTSAIDLHPGHLGAFESKAIGTQGNHQVGTATFLGVDHAFLWAGTASSAIDLNPTLLPGIVGSIGFGVHGNQQVGVALQTLGQVENAMLWTGTAASAVNLHPDHLGMASSRATASNGSIQIGTATTLSELQHAFLWSGTAASAIDLHQLLPSDFYSSSADAIDAQGNIFGWAATDAGVVHAVRWSPDQLASPADFNEDGTVDDADLDLWRGGFGTQTAAIHDDGDADTDGDVDGGDFLTWQRQLSIAGGSRASAAPVPEPRSIALAAGATAVMLSRRRVVRDR